MSDAAVDDTSRSAASVPEFPHQTWFAVALSTEVPAGGAADQSLGGRSPPS